MKPGTDRPLRAVVLVDEVSPYRIPFFQGLAQTQIEVTVLPFVRLAPFDGRRATPDLPFRHRHLDSVILRLKQRNLTERIAYIPLRLPIFLARLRPDVVVAYAYSAPTWMAASYCTLVGRGLVLWSESTAHTERVCSALQRRIRRHLIPACDAYVVPSRDARARLLEFGADPKRIYSIVHSADGARFVPGVPDQQPGPTRRILYVGRLVESKGLRFLLDIFRQVSERTSDVRLVLVGEGNFEGALRQRAAQLRLTDRVELSGHLNQEQLAEAYRSADVFVFPTLEDTFGQVVAEAVSSGLPIVCSPFAGSCRELVRQGVNGFVADPRDPARFAQDILEIIENRGLRRRMSEASLDLARRLDVRHAVAAFVRAVQIAAATHR